MTEQSAPPATTAARAPDGVGLADRLRGRVSWWVVGPVLVYLVLVLGGVSQSSIGIPLLRQDPTAPTGHQVGGSVGIRSDEFLTSTPLLLGAAVSGSPDDHNPLTAPQGFTTQMPAGPVSAVVLFDGSAMLLGPYLPDAMLFAAHWWLPFLLLALGAPAYFRLVAGNRWLGLFAAAVIVAAPVSAWWSWSPLGILGFTFAGSSALLLCAERLAERRIAVAAGWGLLAAVLLARTPLHYQPWMLVLALPILLGAVLPLLRRGAAHRAGLVAALGVGGISLAMAALVFLENRASIAATLGTVYPGRRVASGGHVPLEELLGGTALGNLKNMELVGTNASELSSGYTVAAAVALVLLVAGVQFRDRRHRWATMTVLAFSGFWLAWTLVDFGPVAERVPILSAVPPGRAADVLGYLAVVLLCLTLAGARRTAWRPVVTASVAVGALAGLGAWLLRADHLPSLSMVAVVGSSLVAALLAGALTAWPGRWQPYAATVVAGALLVWNVNPVVLGLLDLRQSALAQEMLSAGEQARADGEVWVSDDPRVDALLMATAVPALSGRQLAGPDEDEWRRLDPGAAYSDVWNRGGSFVTFSWTDDPGLTFTNPLMDAILVSGSPCAVAERVPELTVVISGAPLVGDCLGEERTFEWGGDTHWQYRVTG